HLAERPLQQAGDAVALPVAVHRRALARKPAREQHLPPGAAVEDRPGVALVAEASTGRERLDVERARPAGGEQGELLRPYPGWGQQSEELLQRGQRDHDPRPWGGRAKDGSGRAAGASTA